MSAVAGFASYLLEMTAGRWVVVGHDKRFIPEFAAAAAEVLVGNGLNVYPTNGATPTPVIALLSWKRRLWCSQHHCLAQPPTDNGFKVRDSERRSTPMACSASRR
jgi:phosphomannomutase